MSEKKIGTIGHIDHRKTSLTAAITKVLSEHPMTSPDTAAPTGEEVVAVYWIFTDPETGMECGMHDEARAALFREQHPTWPETHLFPQAALDAMRAERDEAHAGWRNASELLDAAVGDYNTEQARAQALEAELLAAREALSAGRITSRSEWQLQPVYASALMGLRWRPRKFSVLPGSKRKRSFVPLASMITTSTF